MTFTKNFSSFNENEKFPSGDYQVSDFKKEKFEKKNLENWKALSRKLKEIFTTFKYLKRKKKILRNSPLSVLFV